MARNSLLEDRLREWAREYGGGRYDDTSWQGISPMHSLMKYHGRPPQGLNPKSTKDWTPADDVQRALDVMLSDGQWAPVQVITAFYMAPWMAMEERMQRLRDQGLPMGQATFYRHLNDGRKTLARLLGLCDDGEIIQMMRLPVDA